MNVLLVHAHPEPTSLTSHLVEIADEVLQAQGHEVIKSDLYRMQWKAVYDDQDFPRRANKARLSFIEESGHAFANGYQTSDVEEEQRKILAADAVILIFPLWWFSMPAIMKGWVDRVWAFGLAYGYQGAGNTYRYGEGGFAGKRALLAVSVGGPEQDYSPRGINGPLEQLLFPVTHGTLFFTGMQVLPSFAVYGTGHMDTDRMSNAVAAWRNRLERLFDDEPIAFRPQNGGAYSKEHVLDDSIAPNQSGLMVHIADNVGPNGLTESFDSLVATLRTGVTDDAQERI
ncbi:NAD(P)H dehydrogenase (quinone) [Paraburkholderia eburnea]|uniref:NAD(P)H dehydrogenase (Quinone) n=1 Tax=Paraburkholderia eburnea TaxID=1189126 RepID=A0A2S4M256_9BURK|nr:NAD(P)H-dependent oxidoreductase [Paraburkholderia eburnea]POR48791.1 NAD(P)H dehydrogenase (quinone) [Paraburkholderia eburnea]